MRCSLICSLVLVPIALGCSGGLGVGQPPSGSPVPAELQGQWQSILTYVPANYAGILPITDVNGSFGIFYYFSADGQYQISLRALASYFDFNCTLNAHRQEVGTVTIVGADFTFNPTHAFESTLDSCGESRYVDPAPVQGRTVMITPELDAAGWPHVRLHFPDGEQVVLERCRDCQ